MRIVEKHNACRVISDAAAPEEGALAAREKPRARGYKGDGVPKEAEVDKDILAGRRICARVNIRA